MAERVHAEVLAALRSVPEVRLAIYGLYDELVGPDGAVDTLRATERAEELMAAVDQANAYVHTTRQVMQYLRRGHWGNA